MLKKTSDLRLGEPDLALMGKLSVAENLFLATVSAVAVLNVIGWMIPSARNLFTGGWRPMSVEAAVAALLTAASLALSRPRYGSKIQTLSMGIGLLVATCSALVLSGQIARSAPELFSSTVSWVGTGMMPMAAGCFLLLGVTAVLIRTQGRAGILADLSAFCLLFIVAVLVSAELLAAFGMFGQVTTFATSGQTALCLLLLATVIFLRRAENGLFTILVGGGIGSKVARVFAPILVVMPYLREGLRAHFINFHRMPPHYQTALLATIAVALSIALLMYMAWRLNALETEIHGLSLRDPLTGLYNLRGFRLLAEQGLLLARRSGQPFSVLFVDVDNLKQINDALGHQTGSDLLAAIGDLLREVFRETDVLGRVGGDEFAVAGQFSRSGIAEAAQRLRRATMLFNAEAAKSTLNFSAGWVTSDPQQRGSLTDLLAKADEEMYSDKRRRKASAVRAKLTVEIDSARTPQQDSSESSKVPDFGRI